MPYTTNYDQTEEIIIVQAHQLVTVEDMLSSIPEIMELATKYHTNKVLVDTEKVDKMPDPFELIKVVENIPAHMILAFLIIENKSTKNDFRFFETAAVNRAKNVELFNSKTKALEWLNKD